MTLTTPPIAEEPNSKAAGPRSTSIRSAVSGLIATAWSTLVLEASRLPMPSVSTRTRSPWKPRSTGREALGPNEVAETPGWRASVSPIVGRRSRVSSSPLTTEVPDEDVAAVAGEAGDDDLLLLGRVEIGRRARGCAGRRRLCRAAAGSAAGAGVWAAAIGEGEAGARQQAGFEARTRPSVRRSATL